MINGVHAMLYTKEAEKTRAFFRDVLKLGTVDAGHGWLIFALPPAEMGVHPADDGEGRGLPSGTHQLYLMCDDIEKTVAELKGRGVEFSGPVKDQGWGLVTNFKLPGGEELGLYQPRHATALHLSGR